MSDVIIYAKISKVRTIGPDDWFQGPVMGPVVRGDDAYVWGEMDYFIAAGFLQAGRNMIWDLDWFG